MYLIDLNSSATMKLRTKFILLTIVTCISATTWSNSNIPFRNLNTDDGLSNNQVYAIHKDQTGFIWIGTMYGLNRFDGSKFVTYKHNPNDSTSLGDNFVLKIIEDQTGVLWILSRNSTLSFYHPKEDIFTKDLPIFHKNLTIPTNIISDINSDNEGNIWICNNRFGVYYYNFKNDSIIWLRHDTENPKSISSNNVSSIVQGNNGFYWLVNQQGIIEKLDPATLNVVERVEVFSEAVKSEVENFRLFIDGHNDVWVYSESRDLGAVQFIDATKEIVRFSNQANSDYLIDNTIVSGITQDREGIIWISTDHGGIIQFNKRSKQINVVQNNKGEMNSLPQNSITTIYTDNTGITWLGMYKKGVAFYHPDFFKFKLFTHNPFNSNSLCYNDVNCFTEDKKGNIWIGTNGKGLNYFDRRDQSFKHLTHNPNNPNSISNNIIISLLSDSKERLWVGTYFGGLNLIEGSSITRFEHLAEDKNSISHNRIWTIFEDSKGTIWIGTLGGGVDAYIPENKSFINYSSDSNYHIKSDFIYSIEEDDDGLMWFGTIYGLYVLDCTTMECRAYFEDNKNKQSLSSNIISAIKKDKKGRIWIGTSDGLNLYNKNSDSFTIFRKEDGLPEDDIIGIEYDNAGNLWITTRDGLSNMIIEEVNDTTFKYSFKNYNKSDGLQGSTYTDRAILHTNDGHILVGGVNGFNMFNPLDINTHNNNRKVDLLNFELFNKIVKPNQYVGNQVLLTQSIISTDEITLRHKDNIFSIEFKALDFFHPERLSYQYRVDGFTTNWLSLPKGINTATLTNLNPGKYTFRVRVSDDGTNWSPERTLSINIKPAPLATTAAKIFYVIIIILLIYYFRNFILHRERLKHKLATAEKDAMQKQELTNLKTKFITNVSHEFRTPLTLILAHTEKLSQNRKLSEFSKQLTMIEKNGKRLLQLVNQLLDFRKMEVNQLKLNKSQGDIIAFLEEITATFYDLSESKNLNLTVHSEATNFEAYFDHDKLEKIVFNLLSNAFKFTPEHGEVKVLIDIINRSNSKYLELKVSDTGVGIPAEMQNRIFERFYQQESTEISTSNGTGVGLALTKQFVELHNGTIQVESLAGKGSTFTVFIPLITINPNASSDKESIDQQEENDDFITINSASEQVTESELHTVLVVEDNTDLREYLIDNLQANYHVLSAPNGRKAWELLIKDLPDLIVSDVMMPEMDGIELCNKIKQDTRTSHIPVILLTAKSSVENKMEGLKTGADDYITKPFSFELLELRIRNSINSREKLRSKFSKNFAIEPSEVCVTSLDEQLLLKVLNTVDDNIANESYSVEQLSKEVGLSRAHLYKKLLALTGKTPVQFIRIMRLKRAADLLKSSQLTVTEVAYKVGYSGSRYFSKHFKEEFKISPSEYKTRES